MSSSSILGCQSRVSLICASGSIFYSYCNIVIIIVQCENPSCFASLFIFARSCLVVYCMYPCDQSTHYLLPYYVCVYVFRRYSFYRCFRVSCVLL